MPTIRVINDTDAPVASIRRAADLEDGEVFEFEGEYLGVKCDDGAVTFPMDPDEIPGANIVAYSNEELEDCSLEEVTPRPDLRLVIGVEKR